MGLSCFGVCWSLVMQDSVRRDYDLCESCEATDQSPFPFLKIRDPQMAPQVRSHSS